MLTRGLLIPRNFQLTFRIARSINNLELRAKRRGYSLHIHKTCRLHTMKIIILVLKSLPNFVYKISQEKILNSKLARHEQNTARFRYQLFTNCNN